MIKLKNSDDKYDKLAYFIFEIKYFVCTLGNIYRFYK